MGYEDVLAMAFSPDGKTVAFAGSGTTVRLWDPATGKERLPREAHDWQVSAVAYSPDGRTVAGALFGGDSPVRLWSAETRPAARLVRQVETGRLPPRLLAGRPGGRGTRLRHKKAARVPGAGLGRGLRP